MATQTEKLEKVLYLNGQDIRRVEENFSGQSVVHWVNGEPMEEEQFRSIKVTYQKKDLKKRKIILEK